MGETISKQKYLSFKEIAAYSLGLFGFQAIVGLLNSYQAEFDGSILGANVSVVAILILIAKIVSAVADPVVGNLVDRSKSKMGKFKSMIVYSIIPLLIFTAVIFIDVPFKENKIATYIWIFVTYLIWSIAMTMGDVPSQGIAAALTPNPTERTNVVSISNTFKQVGFSACVVIVPIVCLIIPNGSKVFVKSGNRYPYDCHGISRHGNTDGNSRLCAVCSYPAYQQGKGNGRIRRKNNSKGYAFCS